MKRVLNRRPKAAARKKRASPRIKRTFSQLFLDQLGEMSEGEQKLIGNRALRDALNWDEDRYARVRTELVDQGKLLVGRGQGGTVGLATAPNTKALTVFISYSHIDEPIKVELVKHLEPLKKMQLIEAWNDRKIKPGEEWDKSISSNLEKADIILLLVSIDFINSSYCYDIELERAIERHSKAQATVIPVILRSCMWQRTSFAKLQALPKDARAVTQWSDRDEVLALIASDVRQVAESILASR